MANDEKATIAALDRARAVFTEHIEANRGRVVDTAGDSVLAGHWGQVFHFSIARRRFVVRRRERATAKLKRMLK